MNTTYLTVYEISYSADIFGEQELFKEYVTGSKKLAEQYAFSKCKQTGMFYSIKAIAVKPLA